MSTEAQNLSHEMILPAYKAADIYVPIGHTFTTVESALQIRPFMRNKPNFRKAKMNVSAVKSKGYENKSNWTLGENEPNTNPNEPNQSQYKANQSQYKPKTNPIKPNFKRNLAKMGHHEGERP